MGEQVVVRFAPSPTGYLHIGGARTAIFNWLLARKTRGKFILRIEDTDKERSFRESIQGIVDSLSWLGLDWDEGPNFQSGNIQDHLAAADTLLHSGHAYKCFCSKTDLDQKREQAKAAKKTYVYDGTCRHLNPEQIREKEALGLPWSVRLKVPRDGGSLVFEDAVYGRIEKRYRDLEDFIILRSDRTPLYILSNAVDDIRDKVTHVIRGQDGLANTPKQILIYEALNAPLPVFAHMSLTLDPSKAKISKRRHGEKVSIQYYREKGFLPWGLVNFLVLLGWATPDSKEIFSKEELIGAFNLGGISKTNAVFNIHQKDPRFITDPKALSINAHHLRSMDIAALWEMLRPLFEQAGLYDPSLEDEKRSWLMDTLDLIRSRFHLTTDFITQGRAWFDDDFSMDSAAVDHHLLSHPALEGILPALGRQMGELPGFDAKDLEAFLKERLKSLEIKPAVLVNGMRVALTGRAKGPDFMDTLTSLGQDTVCRRLKGVKTLFSGSFPDQGKAGSPIRIRISPDTARTPGRGVSRNISPPTKAKTTSLDWVASTPASSWAWTARCLA